MEAILFKFAAIVAAGAALVLVATQAFAATTIVVTPTNEQGWSTPTRDPVVQ